MTITDIKNGNELTLKIEGSINTTTAPELESHISAAIDDISKLVLDFKEVSYISSAGLRVLLTTRKNMAQKGELLLCNVNADVMEIFEVTGFNEILTIL